LLNQRVGKWGATEVADVVYQEYHKFFWSVLRVENNAMQEAARQWIQEYCQMKINAGELNAALFIHTEPHTTTAANKWDLAVGLPALAAECEAGRWGVVLPDDHEGGNFCRCWFCNLLTEARGFRRNGTSLAPHDDRIFSWWFCREAIRANSSGLLPDTIGKDTREIKQPANTAKRSVKTELSGW